MTVEEVRRLLETARAEKLARLERLRGGLTVEREIDGLDDALNYSTRDQARAEREPLVQDLRAIDEALARLADGSAGICVGCEEPIPDKRLAAIPWAVMCAPCQERAERGEAA